MIRFGTRVARRTLGAASRTTSGRRMGKAAIYGGAAGVGIIGAVTDNDSRWGDIQEDVFGERNILGTGMRAGVASAFLNDPTKNVTDQAHRSYYGRPFNTSSYHSQRSNADGNVVLGLYNLRRGY